MFTLNKQKHKFAVIYEAGIMAGSASIAQAPLGDSTFSPSPGYHSKVTRLSSQQSYAAVQESVKRH